MSVLKYQNVKSESPAKSNNKVLIILLFLCVITAAVMICINKFKQLDVSIGHSRTSEKIPEMIPGVCTIQGLRIRRDPSLDTDILGLLDRNELVKVLSVSGNTLAVDGMTAPWLEIEIPDEKLSGWVFSGYIETDKELLTLLSRKKPALTTIELQNSEVSRPVLASAEQPIENKEIIPDPFTIVILEEDNQ